MPPAVRGVTMQKFKRVLPVILLLIWDVLSVAASVFIAFHLTYWASVPSYFQNHRFLYICGISFIMVVLNAVCGCYNGVWRNVSFSDLLRLLLSSTLGAAAIYVADKLAVLYIPGFNRNLLKECIIMLIITVLLLMIAGRISVRFVLAARAKVQTYMSTEMTRTIIYGAGEAGTYLLKKLQNNPDMNLLPVALIDDDESLHGRKICGVKVYGGHEKLDEAIKKCNAGEVIVAIPTASRQTLEHVLDVCRANRCSMKRFGTLDEPDLSKVTVSEINLEELLRRDSVKLNMAIVKEFIEGKTVLVTGGAGSIGSEICRQVLGLGCKKLVIFDIHENGLFYIDNELKEKYKNSEFEVRLGSIRDRERLGEIFEEFQPQVVFHAAAHKHVPMMEINPCEAIKNNVMGTINVAQMAIAHHVEKFILISTDKAVNPTNIMGASKRITEMVIQMMDTVSDTDFAAVRFGNVLGSNGSVVPFFRKQIASGGPVTVTHPDMRRYFMTIPEAVQLVLEAGAMASGGEIFVLDMGEPVKISDLAKDLIRLSGYEPDKDIKIVFTGLRPGEKLFEEISMKDEDVTKTANSKIVVMKPIEFDSSELSKRIKELEESVTEENRGLMFERVKILVPTFHHNCNGTAQTGEKTKDEM